MSKRMHSVTLGVRWEQLAPNLWDVQRHKEPLHLIAFWKNVMALLLPEEREALQWECKIFARALRWFKPLWIGVAPPGAPRVASAPAHMFATLKEALAAFRRFREQVPERRVALGTIDGVRTQGPATR